jgi:hypothetical protein
VRVLKKFLRQESKFCWWEGSIKMDLSEMGYKDTKGIELAQDSVIVLVLVLVVMKFKVCCKSVCLLNYINLF